MATVKKKKRPFKGIVEDVFFLGFLEKIGRFLHSKSSF